MSTTTANQPSTISASLRRAVVRYPVAAFLAMTFAFAWSIMLPVLLSEQGLDEVTD